MEPAPCNECRPVKSCEELYSTLEDQPSWYEQTVALLSRSDSVMLNMESSCHIYNNAGSPYPKRVSASTVPRTIACHDMKNGYLEDKYTDEVAIGNGYTFMQWQTLDMFIYFSHHFITIPPLAWINVAHRNGVAILGTIVTEWKEGEAICAQFLRDEAEMLRFVEALVCISVSCKLDGWLINIENKIEPEKVDLLVQFVAELTSQLHAQVKSAVVLWYDSVIQSGELKWQNELNDDNRCFFDACDGIFINYNWTGDQLERSAKIARDRRFDVYAGVDCFGRNTPYPAGEPALGVLRARQFDVSAAIFAPGWSHECLPEVEEQSFFKCFVQKDFELWDQMWPCLYTHPVENMFHTGFHPGVNRHMYALQQQELHLTIGSCCVRPTVHDDRCGYQIEFMFPGSWHHLLVTEIALPEACEFIARTQQHQGCEFTDLVLVVEGPDKVSNILCRAGPEEKYEIPLEDDETVTRGAMSVGPRDQVEVRFLVRFPESSTLKHIYASSPSSGEAILTELSVKAVL